VSAVRVFVASSAEAETVAGRLQLALRRELNGSGVVDLWRDKFELSHTTIESLETIAEEADFAMLLMTGDDITVSRNKESLAPRDNLVFELGLFIGTLGRERSIVVRERKAELKLPSDFLGVTTLNYDHEKLETSLQEECAKLAEQILKRGARLKLSAHARTTVAENRDFCRALQGLWWQKIHSDEGSALSCFTITPEPMTRSLELKGSGYGKEGNLFAYWKSEMVRLYSSERRITYLWEGTHSDVGLAHLKFHGYGKMEFDAPHSQTATLLRGKGVFWDVDEFRPECTVARAVEVRRLSGPADDAVMTSGSADEKQTLVKRMLDSW
jgi:hypothetical protein